MDGALGDCTAHLAASLRVVLHRLVVASTDRDTSASFAHHRLASRILGLIN